MKKFSEIPIDRTEINQNSLNIANKVRSNIFTWNGQFSPQFIEEILYKYAQQNYVVIDPFLGSGTVLYECARKNISAYGMELNASAYFMAKAYEITNITFAEREKYLSPIDKLINSILRNEDVLSTLLEFKENHKGISYNLISLLIILMDIYNNEITIGFLKKKWDFLKQIIVDLPYSQNKISAFCGDARNIGLNDDFADLLITSPPYINVFNYHQKYRRSVETLGFDVLKTAKTEFGSNRKNRGNRLLTVIQYCIDMALAMYEASRVCKENARMIYVVGRESAVLGYSFCNSELIYEIGLNVLNFDFLIRQERVFKNRYGQMIYEDVLHFSNNKYNYDKKDIIEKSRKIAEKVLKEKSIFISDNSQLLVEAISNINKIRESEAYV